MEIQAVDHDPFAAPTEAVNHDPFAPGFSAVEHDPFAPIVQAVDHDPFSENPQTLTGWRGAHIDPVDLAEWEKNYRLLEKYRGLPASENVDDRREEWRFGRPALQRMYEYARDTLAQNARDLIDHPFSFPEVPENEFNRNVGRPAKVDPTQ